MVSKNNVRRACAVCGKTFAARHVVSGELVRKEIAEGIPKTHPDRSPASFLRRADRVESRGKYVHSLLESGKGELSELERKWSLGERLADRIATFGGSWAFLAPQIAASMVVRVTRPPDPYPFIFLDRLLSRLRDLPACAPGRAGSTIGIRVVAGASATARAADRRARGRRVAWAGISGS